MAGIPGEVAAGSVCQEIKHEKSSKRYFLKVGAHLGEGDATKRFSEKKGFSIRREEAFSE